MLSAEKFEATRCSMSQYALQSMAQMLAEKAARHCRRGVQTLRLQAGPRVRFQACAPRSLQWAVPVSASNIGNILSAGNVQNGCQLERSEGL